MTNVKCGSRLAALAFAALSWCGGGLAVTGCYSSLHETYYLAAKDPVTRVTNFFRIQLDGQTSLSRAKYSVGFYDRDAVEKLFGETSLQKELLARRLESLSQESNQDLKDLSAALDKSKTALDQVRQENLAAASGTVAGLIERFRTRFSADKQGSIWLQSLDRAAAAQAQAAQALNAGGSPKLAEAESNLRTAQVILETIRIGVDSSVLVRFFDGAGNELDVTTKTQVVFVATDVSRFANALSNLATSEVATQNLLQAVLGKKIQEQELIAKRVSASETKLSALDKRLTDTADPVKDLPRDRKGKSADDAAKERTEDLAKLKDAILKSATALAERGTTFTDEGQIRSFADGLGGGAQ